MKRITSKTFFLCIALGILAWPTTLAGQTAQLTTAEKPFTHVPGQIQFQYNPYHPTVDPRFSGYAYDYLHLSTDAVSPTGDQEAIACHHELIR